MIDLHLHGIARETVPSVTLPICTNTPSALLRIGDGQARTIAVFIVPRSPCWPPTRHKTASG
jgi:hypothetical protein